MKENDHSFLSIATVFIRFVRLLNIDIIAGVCCSSLFASILFDVKLPYAYYLILLSSVWIIYSSDQLFDAFISRRKGQGEYYQFHYKYRVAFMVSIALLVLLNCTLLRFLESEVIIFGSGMLVLVLFYLLLNFIVVNERFFPLKEICIAVLYTMGIFGGAALSKGGADSFQWLVIISFLLISKNQAFFTRNQSYGIVTDAVFILPVLSVYL